MVYPESCFMNKDLDIFAVNTQNPNQGQSKTSLDVLSQNSSYLEILLDATALRNAACYLEYF